MTVMATTRIASFGLVAALVGCGGGGGTVTDALQECRSIHGGSTAASARITPSCVGCTVSEPQRAADGDGGSYATLHMPAGSGGTVALRATAQAGTVFAAGSLAGFVAAVTYGPSASAVTEIVTYAGGVEQERFPLQIDGTGQSNGPLDRPGYEAARASRQYDAVEFSFTRASGAGEMTTRVHAFCSN